MVLDMVLRRCKLDEKDAVCVYSYGSRVYGNYGPNSDFDFIIVTNSMKGQFSDNMINVNFFTAEEHQRRLEEHEPSALECQFLPAYAVLMEKKKFEFRLDIEKLRRAFSAKSSNSWVKAKKKLTVEKDYNDQVGKKSLWHSMRIIDFGLQIVEHGKISDYSSCNHFFDEVMHCYDWTEMFEKYKQRYNKMRSDFRAAVPI